jgi:hypothetical protein
MPAGLVLVVLVGALALAMVGNADATLRRSQAKRGNAGWRTEIAQQVAHVSDFFHLTAPRRGIDDAMGRAAKTKSLEEIKAEQVAGVSSDGSTDTTVADPATLVPKLRTPTAASPLKLWVGGDSVTETFGTQLVRVSQGTGLFKSTLDFHLGTGLCVPSYFNWPQHLVEDVLPKDDPDVVVIMFGANDGQNIEMAQGKVLERFSPEWYAEYEHRVAGTMDLLRSPTNDRVVLWAGPPPMGPTTKTHGMDRIGNIAWKQAQTRPWVHFVDTWPFFTDSDLQFQHSVPMASGEVKGLRQKDDIHMSDIGGTLLSWVVLDDLKAFVDLSGSKTQPTPGEIRPPEVKERVEVPETVPGAL